MFLHVPKFWSGLISFWLNAIAQQGLHFFLGHSLFSCLCPMKLAPVFVFHVSGWYMAMEKLFLQNAGGVFFLYIYIFFNKASLAKSWIATAVKTVHTIPSIHESEGCADKNNLGQLSIPSIDNVKFLRGNMGFLSIKLVVKLSPHETPRNQILLKAVRIY